MAPSEQPCIETVEGFVKELEVALRHEDLLHTPNQASAPCSDFDFCKDTSVPKIRSREVVEGGATWYPRRLSKAKRSIC